MLAATPLFKHDELTNRVFGGHISRYDFKRSEEDQSTVKLVYENRGEKLGIARLDRNDRICLVAAVEHAQAQRRRGACRGYRKRHDERSEVTAPPARIYVRSRASWRAAGS